MPRSVVWGGYHMPWRHKGTGRARQGSTRSPHWRHGGIVFGPHPRDYRLGIPKKVRQLAKKSALNARAREEALFVVRSEEHTSELQSQSNLVCRLLLEKKKNKKRKVM